jgi:hypothetical protein
MSRQSPAAATPQAPPANATTRLPVMRRAKVHRELERDHRPNEGAAGQVRGRWPMFVRT